MTGRHAGAGDDDGLIRPFVAGPPSRGELTGRPGPAGPAPLPAHPGRGPAGPGSDHGPAILRPYLLTSGRVAPSGVPLEVEAQVVASHLGRASYRQLAFERRDIVLLCHTPMSVAEVAARLQYHIGVARVLIADLATLGHIVVRRPEVDPALDIAMIERVIRALESIP